MAAGVFTPDAGEPHCDHCGTLIEWSGRGARPRWCALHKRERDRRTAQPRRQGPAKPGAKRPAAMPWTVGYASLGAAVQLRGPEPWGPPLGTVMQMQAPDAGPRIERIAHKLGTALPWLPKFTEGHSELARDLAAIVLPPLIVVAVATDQIPRPIAEAVLGTLLRPAVAELLRQSKEAAESMAAMTEAEAEISQATADMLAALFPTKEAPNG